LSKLNKPHGRFGGHLEQGVDHMKIAKHLGRLFGIKNQTVHPQEAITKPSIVHIGDRGQPVRVALDSFKPQTVVRGRIPTGTIKVEADKLKFIGLDMNNHPIYVNDTQLGNMGRGLIILGVTNTTGMEQIYADADLAKAMSSNIQSKVVVRAEGEGK